MLRRQREPVPVERAQGAVPAHADVVPGSAWRGAWTSTPTSTPISSTTPRRRTPAPVGCELNPFDPSFALVAVDARRRTRRAGWTRRLRCPRTSARTGSPRLTSNASTVTLPEGLSINPSSADGLQACTDAQLRLVRRVRRVSGRVEARHRHAEDAAARSRDRRVDLLAHPELRRPGLGRAVPHRGRGPLRRRRHRDPAARRGQGRPGHGPADDGVRRVAAAAVRVDAAALQDRSARPARHTGRRAAPTPPRWSSCRGATRSSTPRARSTRQAARRRRFEPTLARRDREPRGRLRAARCTSA